jgi:hypothetical protein
MGGQTGVGNVCAYDNATICSGGIDASENYWGCSAGPNAGSTCGSTYGESISFTPWLTQPNSAKPN